MSRVWAVVVILARMSVAAAEEPVAGEPSSAVASEGDVRALRLVYTGGRRGLMATQHRFELHERLQEALADRAVEVQSVDVVHGVLAQGPHLVLPVDGHLASLRDGLSVEAPRCGEGVTVEAWVTDTEELLIEPGALPVAALGDARREARIWRRCEAGGHEMVWVAPSAEPGEPSWQLGAFDVRTGFRHGLSEGAGVWWQIARPRLEPGRHIAALRQALAEHDGALFVHAGDFLGGASALHVGELSVHREVQLAAVSALKPAALAPGHGELAGGVSRFFEEAARYGLPYVATNWRAEDPALALPAVRRVVVATPGGPVDVALLGVVDPLVGVTSPALADAGIELVEPVAAVHEVVDALWAGEDPPDVVVLLARVEPRLQADLRARLHGVDLLVGDITAATYRVEEERTTFRQVSRSFKASPVTLPMDGGDDRLARSGRCGAGAGAGATGASAGGCADRS